MSALLITGRLAVPPVDSRSGEEDASDPLVLLPPPLLTVSKSDAIVQVMPTALRFWEKLGLGPKAGLKNVTAFVFYEARGPERESQIAAWIDQVSATYAVCSASITIYLKLSVNTGKKLWRPCRGSVY